MEPITRLWNGFDIVKVNFGVAWPEDFMELLATLEKHKQEAFEAMEPVVFSLCAVAPFDRVVALEKGNRHARYGVQVEGLTVFFSSRQIPSQDTPNLYVEAGPEYVAENGLGALYGFVLNLIAHLGGEYLWNKVSEVHMTVDYAVDAPHTIDDYRIADTFTFVTRARTKAPRYGCTWDEQDATDQDAALFFKGNRLETMQIGKGQMMLRIYDKQAELACRPRKAWERLLWCDVDAQHVMRTEFQVRRESLKELGYDTIENVMDRAGELWSYLTAKWFRLYTHIDDPKPMAVLHPFWMAVQGAWEEKMPAVKKKVYHELRLQRAQQLLGHATSLAAVIQDQHVLTLDDLFALMRKLVQEMLPEQDIPALIRDKAIRFQCRNKADIDMDDDDASHAGDAPSHPGEVNRGGDVIQTPPAPKGPREAGTPPRQHGVPPRLA
ncbi:MAG TPA: hypothetical protein VHQ47_06015 [Phycisphaerae bacterium]|nr:hypothetical protein [Phycisphaerae bacterium]